MTTDAEIFDALAQIETDDQRLKHMRQIIDQQLARLDNALNDVELAIVALNDPLPH